MLQNIETEPLEEDEYIKLVLNKGNKLNAFRSNCFCTRLAGC